MPGDICSRQSDGAGANLEVLRYSELQGFITDAHTVLYGDLIGSRKKIMGGLYGYQVH